MRDRLIDCAMHESPLYYNVTYIVENFGLFLHVLRETLTSAACEKSLHAQLQTYALVSSRMIHPNKF